MATYYIDPSGDDVGGDGSTGNPWASLSYACSQVAAGDHTIHVNPGEYPVDSTQASVRAGVKIEGEGDTSHLHTDYTTASSYLGWIHYYSAALADGDQWIKNVKINGDSLSGFCAINIVNRNNVTIDSVTIVDFEARGINIRHDGAGATFLTGTEIKNCTISNCADRLASSSCGLIVDKGTDGTLIHDNILTQNSRASQHNGNIYTSWDTTHSNKNTKFYNNICSKPDEDGVLSGAGGWNFHIESGGTVGGVEVCNNTFIGGVAIDLAAAAHTKGASDFSWWIHHNYHYLTAQQSYVANTPRSLFVDLERTAEDVIIEYNRAEKVTEPIGSNIADGYHLSRIHIRYNIFSECGYSPSVVSPVRAGIRLGATHDNSYVEYIYIYNNVISGNGIISGIDLHAITDSEVENVYIKNNIITGIVTWGWLSFEDDGGTYENIYAWNNCIHDCVTDDTPYYEGGVIVTNYDPQNNITDDPLFVSSSDFSLQPSSPCIDAGIDVGLTSDFIGTLVPYGSAPDIGAYEWFEVVYDFAQITLVNTPACHNEDDPSIISRWVATEVPILFTLLRRDWYVISTADNGGFVRINILGTFGGNDDDTIALYDETTESMYTGTIIDSSAAPIIDTDIPYVAGMEFRYMNDHTLYPNYYFEGRLTIEGVLEPLTVTASPDRFGLADLDVSGILRIHTAIGKVTNYLSLIQKDTNKSGKFTLEYRGCWFGSDEDYIQEGSETSPVEANVWYFAEAVRSEEQGCNLAEYVPSDENEAPFLNQFDQPVYWHGLPFDLSFILPEIAEVTPEADITVTIKVYDSTHSQIGVDIVQTIAADEMEGYVNSLNIDSALIDEGAAYFTVEITTV